MQDWIRRGKVQSIIGDIPGLRKGRGDMCDTFSSFVRCTVLAVLSHSEIRLSTVVFQKQICFYVA